MGNSITQEDLILAYRLHGSFADGARSLGISRRKFASLWWKYVQKDPCVYKKVVPHRFGVVSDTHLGSIYQQVTLLDNFYKYAKAYGCEYIIHAGDLTDGMSHAKDSFVTNVDSLIDYLYDVYPRDLPTYLLSGNHDNEFVHRLGIDVCKEFSDIREDICYVGNTFSRLYLNGTELFVSHIANVTRFRSKFGDAKMVINGHVHRFSISRNNNNVMIINAPCMLADDNSDVGALIVEIDYFMNVDVKYVHYNPIKGDF